METFQRNVARFSEKEPLLASLLGPAEPLSFVETALPSGYDVLFLEGVEKGEADGEGKLVLVETDLAKLAAFLATDVATRWFDNPKRELAFVSSDEALRRLAWRHLFLRAYIEPKNLRALFAEIHAFASEFRELGAPVLQNFAKNSELDALDGMALRGAFAGLPAVVCGAGPTLQLPDPKMALVLACGSAMGKVPDYHFGVALDPTAVPQMGTAPLIYQNRAASALVAKASRRISMAGSGLYPIEEAFFGKREPFDGGWNAGAMGVALAHFFGCAPIYITGIGGGESGDRPLALQWIEPFSPQPFVPLSKTVSIEEPIDLPPLHPPKNGVAASRKRCAAYLDALIAMPKKRALYEVELEGELFYQKHLAPLWEIWQWAIAREASDDVDLRKLLFLQTAVRACDVG